MWFISLAFFTIYRYKRGSANEVDKPVPLLSLDLAHKMIFLNSPLPFSSLSSSEPLLFWPLALLSTLVKGCFLFATGEGTGVSNTGRSWWPMGAPLWGHMTGLSKEVVEGVTQIGNVMLVEAPVLLLCLSQTLH